MSWSSLISYGDEKREHDLERKGSAYLFSTVTDGVERKWGLCRVGGLTLLKKTVLKKRVKE